MLGIGPAEAITLLLGWALVALLVVGALVALYQIIRKATAAGIRDAREDFADVHDEEED